MKKDCTIIISHYESLPFLRACIRQIRKYRHPEIEQHIIISDQSSTICYNEVVNEFGNCADITIAGMSPLYSGYGIDYIMRFVNIKTKYICQLHVDAFPIHKNWLYLSIKLMEENGYVFVGQNHFISKPTDTQYYYLKNMFFSMSPTFNVSRTSVYKEMALEGGFTRYHERRNIDIPMTFKNNDWEEWAKEDYSTRGSDDDVIAYCWADNHRQYDKLGFITTHIMGVEGEESGYGRIIEDIVFHWGFCRESIGVGDLMGQRYCDWTKRINNGFDDDLINEMLTFAKGRPCPIQRLHWDGKLKVATPLNEKLVKRISELKEYDSKK